MRMRLPCLASIIASALGLAAATSGWTQGASQHTDVTGRVTFSSGKTQRHQISELPEEVDRARRRRDADAKRVVGSGGAGSGSSNGESGSDNWRARKKRLLRRAAPVPYDDGVFVTPVVFRSAAERELARLWACIGELTADCLCRITRRTLRERGITVEAGVDYVTLGHETELVYDDKDRYADCLSLARDECSSRQRQRQQRERQDDVGGQNDQPSHALGQITGGTSADTPEALDILGPWNVHQWHAFHLRSCMCSWMIFTPEHEITPAAEREQFPLCKEYSLTFVLREYPHTPVHVIKPARLTFPERRGAAGDDARRSFASAEPPPTDAPMKQSAAAHTSPPSRRHAVAASGRGRFSFGAAVAGLDTTTRRKLADTISGAKMLAQGARRDLDAISTYASDHSVSPEENRWGTAAARTEKTEGGEASPFGFIRRGPTPPLSPLRRLGP